MNKNMLLLSILVGQISINEMTRFKDINIFQSFDLVLRENFPQAIY